MASSVLCVRKDMARALQLVKTAAMTVVTRSRRLLLAIVLVSLAACTAKSSHKPEAVLGTPTYTPHRMPRAALPGPETQETDTSSPPMGRARQARAIYRDQYAGFQFRPPIGWMEHMHELFTTAPTEGDLLAWPDYLGSGQRFSVTLTVRQDVDFETAVRRQLPNVIGCSSSPEWPQPVETTVAGRTAAHFSLLRPDSCLMRVAEVYLVKWNATTIQFAAVAATAKLWRRFRHSFHDMLDSLSSGPVADSADELTRFMESRIHRKAVHTQLTRRALRDFESMGLYRLDRDWDIYTFSVTQTRIQGDRTIFYVKTIGSRRRDADCPQDERIVLGPGRSLDGRRGSHLLLEGKELQPCFTS